MLRSVVFARATFEGLPARNFCGGGGSPCRVPLTAVPKPDFITCISRDNNLTSLRFTLRGLISLGLAFCQKDRAKIIQRDQWQ